MSQTRVTVTSQCGFRLPIATSLVGAVTTNFCSHRTKERHLPNSWAETQGRQMLRAELGGGCLKRPGADGPLCCRLSTLSSEVLSFQLMKASVCQISTWRGFTQWLKG